MPKVCIFHRPWPTTWKWYALRYLLITTSVVTRFNPLADTGGATFLAGIIYHKTKNVLPNLLFLLLSMVMVCCVFDTKSTTIIRYYLSEICKNCAFKSNFEKHVAVKVVWKKDNGWRQAVTALNVMGLIFIYFLFILKFCPGLYEGRDTRKQIWKCQLFWTCPTSRVYNKNSNTKFLAWNSSHNAPSLWQFSQLLHVSMI